MRTISLLTSSAAQQKNYIDADLTEVDIPAQFLRDSKLSLPSCSELDVVRYATNLSQRNFSVDSHFYPLGSCTMKYNPKIVHQLAMDPQYLALHPLAPTSQNQGLLQSLYELQEMLAWLTGMQQVALTPMAGAQGEWAGIKMIAAYHRDRGDHSRTEILVPDSAHGTNPASAAMVGFKVREIPTKANGDIDLEKLSECLGPHTAGIMLTNPSTLGVFERSIKVLAERVHAAGGLLYYDGANLNAILGKVRPGDMGFDVMHLNLHKTFAVPHGSGGPGAGPVAANARLAPYLPIPRVTKNAQGFAWLTQTDCPQSIGQLSAFMGNMGALIRAYIYMRLLGKKGARRVSEYAVLNANYLMHRLKAVGFELAYPDRRASHEFIITLKNVSKQYGVTALDFAKRLLDYGIHAPTIYFPLLVPECLLIEPTETESKQTLDHFVEVMQTILEESKTQPALVQHAPYTRPVTRLDDVKAARELNLVDEFFLAD